QQRPVRLRIRRDPAHADDRPPVRGGAGGRAIWRPHLATQPVDSTADRGALLRLCGDTPSYESDRTRSALGGRAPYKADGGFRRPQGWLAPPVRQVDAGADA